MIQRIGLPGLFQNAPAIFRDTDLICANLEAAVTSEKTSLNKTFRFNSPLNIGEILAKNKISLVSIANNHSVDYGKTGLRDTVANLTKTGVTPFGYGNNAGEALAPKIIELHGTKIAYIGAVCFPLEGYVYLPDSFDVGRWDAQLIGSQIKTAKQKADIVVVSLHWGIEFSHYPTSTQIQMAHFCIDQGADLVVGQHPHVLQGMEIYRGKPIAYSLGNFIFDQRYGPTTESILLRVTIKGKRIKGAEIVPVVIEDCVPRLAKGETAEKIRSEFLKYSEPFGMKIPTNGWWKF